ncbi:MAG: hypothetical protein IKU65_05030 [Oscillospiraceae bacterium]|nr:hypothetical protein [Oscillospiraceae bacterium]
MYFDGVLARAFKTFFKNIIVNLFFSALMLALPYVEYALITQNAALSVSLPAVFIVSAISCVFVYAPFIVSVHKGRITQLWREIFADVMITAVIFAGVITALFLAMEICIAKAIARTVFAVVIFSALSFVAWEFTILKIINIVCNTQDGEEVKLSAVLLKNKRIFAKVFAECILIVFLLPIAINAFLRRRYVYPEASVPQEISFEKDATVFFMFLFLPFVPIYIYSGYFILVYRK